MIQTVSSAITQANALNVFLDIMLIQYHIFAFRSQPALFPIACVVRMQVAVFVYNAINISLFLVILLLALLLLLALMERYLMERLAHAQLENTILDHHAVVAQKIV